MIRRQGGYVALISVTLVAVLISVITISLVTLMGGEVHQSTDAADRVAAQYAAESGAQDALAYIKANEGTDPGTLNQYCSDPDNVTVLTSGIDPAITCREIVANGSAVGTLGKDKSVQFDLSDTTKLDGGSLEIDWDAHRTGSCSPRVFSSPNFSNGNSWTNSGSCGFVPPALELTVASDSPSNSPAGQQTRSIYLVPQCVSWIDLSTDGACNQSPSGGPPSPPTINFGQLWQSNDTAPACTFAGECAPTSVNCYGTSLTNDYDCKMYVPGYEAALGNNELPEVTGSTQYVLRLRTFYAGGDYQMILRDCGNPGLGGGSCHTVPLALSNARIDVTAQVGGAYQRVVEQAPVRSNPLGSTALALVGEDEICKTFQLFDEGGGVYVPQFNAAGNICPNTENDTLQTLTP